jgi:dTDP-4-amino-4,6-dideoxygalactose transaminase
VTGVPLVDLAWQHEQIAHEVEEGWKRVLAETAFVGGPAVAAFEQEFARYCGVGECVGLANGTDAIELALRALGIGHGSTVAVPANTFVATAEAVLRAGAWLRLVDVDDATLLWDPGACDEEGVDAFVPVHLYGQLAPMDAVVAQAAGRPVVEDAAQSQGATQHGRPMGSWGQLTATSFYPGKNLGAYGDAGAVLTDDAELARAVRLLGSHGSLERYVHEAYGVNSRLDTLQAVVLSAKLARLEEWNELRRTAARRYDELLADVPGVRLPVTAEGNQHVWHLYVVRVANRDEVLAALRSAGVGAAVHYPNAVGQLPPYREMGLPPCPVAERAAAEILTLPLYPGITETQQERVASALAAAVR